MNILYSCCSTEMACTFLPQEKWCELFFKIEKCAYLRNSCSRLRFQVPLWIGHALLKTTTPVPSDDFSPIFMAQEPQIPSLQDLLNVKDGSISFLILIRASSTIGPQLFRSTLYSTILGLSPAVSGSHLGHGRFNSRTISTIIQYINISPSLLNK